MGGRPLECSRTRRETPPPAEVAQKINNNIYYTKITRNPILRGLRGDFKPRVLAYSIKTRKEQPRPPKICADFHTPKTIRFHPVVPKSSTDSPPEFVNNKKPSCRWLASLRETNHHPQYLPRAVVNHKIGTHAGGAGPRDFLFDESGNGERYAEFFSRAVRRWRGVGAQP